MFTEWRSRFGDELACARRDGYVCHALSFDYGQRHRIELTAAARVAASLGAVEHKTALIDLRLFGGSALTSTEIDVPKDRDADAMGQGIPITYVPARNTIFLSFALAWAEVLGASDIFLGVNAVDYSGYPTAGPTTSPPTNAWRGSPRAPASNTRPNCGFTRR